MAYLGRKPKLKAPRDKPPQKRPGLAILEVMEPKELKVGESYFSWICYGCQKMLALMQVAPGDKPEPIPDNIVKVKCTHPGCGAERRYSINERRVRVYEG